MKSLFYLVASILLIGLIRPPLQAQAANQPNSAPSAPQTRIYKTIDSIELKLYLYGLDTETRAPKERAAIIFFFGGGWRSGTPNQFTHHAQYLASRGMIAVTADYRVSSRHQSKAVDSVEDAKSAIRWLREHANELGIDPDRIAAAGGSAGGHLAACAGVIPGLENRQENLTISSQPNAMALFNPAVVLAPVPGYPSSLDPQRLAALENRMGIKPINLSPFHYVRAQTPPTIIFHGQADTTVPFWTAQAFQQAQLRTGGDSLLVSFPGEAHGFFNFGRGNNRAFRKTLKATDTFLQSLGYITGDESVDDYLTGMSGEK